MNSNIYIKYSRVPSDLGLTDVLRYNVFSGCDTCIPRQTGKGEADMKTIVVTGGCGFIGSNFIRYALEARPDWSILNLDALTYAGNLANLADLADHARYRFLRGDIGDTEFVRNAFASLSAPPDLVINFAAESHVDRSLLGPEAFVRTNLLGTFNLLDAFRSAGGGRFVQISTDEVYGALGDTGVFTENTPLDPSSPYSASKAGADLLVQSYHRSFGLDTVVTRCSNNYGPYQFPEKLIPLMVLNAREGHALPVYGKGQNVRDWIHVLDHCRGVLAAAERGTSGHVYNFGARNERANLEIVERIAKTVSGSTELIRFVTDRPGHDWRYAMDPSKAELELGWKAEIPFEEGLGQTIQWYLDNEAWWRPIMSGEYRQFYDRWYGGR